MYASAFASGRRSSAASASAIGSTPFCEASHLDRASALLNGPREDLVRRYGPTSHSASCYLVGSYLYARLLATALRDRTRYRYMYQARVCLR